MTLVGYAGALGIVIFSARSALAALRGSAGKLDPHSFAVLTLASTLLCIYAISLGDAIFAFANGASGFFNAVVMTAAFRHRSQN